MAVTTDIKIELYGEPYRNRVSVDGKDLEFVKSVHVFADHKETSIVVQAYPGVGTTAAPIVVEGRMITDQQAERVKNLEALAREAVRLLRESFLSEHQWGAVKALEKALAD